MNTVDSRESLRIMIVTGEASGDMHGAQVIRALRRQYADCECFGMGGTALAEAGVELLYDAANIAVVGLVEVVAHLGDIRQALRILQDALRRRRPHLLLLLDLPDFNLKLARHAKGLGIPVLYYISPQVWAWRQGRVQTIRQLVDRMAVILPFEQEFYARAGVPVTFVGNPLLDELPPPATLAPGRDAFLEGIGLDPGRPVIGILPGSRRGEVRRMLPVFLEAAQRLQQADTSCQFLLPLAPGLGEEVVCGYGLDGAPVTITMTPSRHRHQAMAACTAVLAASGTVTLELALLQTPMVVAYRVSPMTYWLAHWFIKVPHFSLANLVAGRALVPEFLQDQARPQVLADTLQALLSGPAREKQLAGLRQTAQRLGKPGAAERVAELAVELAARG